jgi:hypothetical protein
MIKLRTDTRRTTVTQQDLMNPANAYYFWLGGETLNYTGLVTYQELQAAVSEGHNHDEVYATIDHNHDDRYYTESEIDQVINALDGRVDVIESHLFASLHSWTGVSGDTQHRCYAPDLQAFVCLRSQGSSGLVNEYNAIAWGIIGGQYWAHMGISGITPSSLNVPFTDGTYGNVWYDDTSQELVFDRFAYFDVQGYEYILFTLCIKI